MYFVIVISLRIMGKRQIGELQPSELVVTIMISNIATLPIEDTNIPLLGGLVPILVLVCWEVFVSMLGIKSPKIRDLVSGSPTFIIKNGVIDQKKLKDLRFSTDDLMESLREQGIFDLRDVDFAVVETTGKISVVKTFPKQTTTAGMMNVPDPASPPPVVIVSDGNFVRDGLEFCSTTEDWVEKQLKKKKMTVKDVFLMTCNQKMDCHIIRKG